MRFTKGENPEDQSDEISVIYRNDKLTTFGHNLVMFIGGAHGYEYQIGTSFSNSTGDIFNWDDLQVTSTPFADMLADGLISYFKADKLEDLNELLILDDEIESSKDIPLPKHGPWIENDSIVLYYEPYEIAPNSAGHPVVKIAVDKADGILTAQGKAFFK